jgi:curved DNA-binding protein CbpA
MIEEAYTILSNPKLKDQYDSSFKESTDENEHTKARESQEKKEDDPDQIVLKDGVLVKAFHKDSEFEDKIKKLEDCSGYFLKKARQYKNISIDEVSKFSKISKLNIVALEEEDLENLPARVFIRGFVLQISRLIGLDEKRFTEGYMKIIDEKSR